MSRNEIESPARRCLASGLKYEGIGHSNCVTRRLRHSTRRAAASVQEPVPAGRAEDQLVVIDLGREAHLHLHHEARGPVSVKRLQAFLLLEPDQPRLLLAGHHRDRLHVAGRVDPAPGDRADPARAAAQEPPHRALDPGRGHAAQLPSGLSRLRLYRAEAGPRLDARDAAIKREDPVQAGKIDDDTAIEGNALAVVSRAGPARRHRDMGAAARRDHRAELVHASRPGRHVRPLVVELAPQHRRVPVEVLRERLEGVAPVDEIPRAHQGAQLRLEFVHLGGHVGQEARMLPSKPPPQAGVSAPGPRIDGVLPRRAGGA